MREAREAREAREGKKDNEGKMREMPTGAQWWGGERTGGVGSRLAGGERT
jgi:hypothetical protein